MSRTYYKLGDKTPCYYQCVAINRTIDAIARGQKRIMLVMATGTGKTVSNRTIGWLFFNIRAEISSFFVIPQTDSLVQ